MKKQVPKNFNSVDLMRELRDKLSEEYNKNPKHYIKELEILRKDLGIKVKNHKHKIAS